MTRARNAYSQGLAASVRIEEVLHALATAIGELAPGDCGYLLRRTDGAWRGWLAAGDHPEVAEGIVVAAPADLDAVVARAECRTSTMLIRSTVHRVLLVPAGPASAATVLALVPVGDADVDEATRETATAIAAEAWAALRRVEAVAELQANARLYEEQRRAAEQSRALDRQRADYVAGITHDLRSPVTAILGFARTLNQAGELLTPAEQREALDTIERQSLRISRMLDDMLDSARAESGQLQPDRRIPVPLHGVVREAVLTSGPDNFDRVDARLDTAVAVCGDADQLTRVVQNLIANALQYAPPGSPVVVSVHADAGHATLQVIDTGPGIPTGLDAFTRFGRGDSRGTGLGLYTVKQIVQLHDGSIDLSATPGGGTTVTVQLPLHDPREGC